MLPAAGQMRFELTEQRQAMRERHGRRRSGEFLRSTRSFAILDFVDVLH